MKLYTLAEKANFQLLGSFTPMQAYKALGIVRDAIDITEILEPLPPPEGTYRGSGRDAAMRCNKK